MRGRWRAKRDFLASVHSFFTDSLLRMAVLLLVIFAALVWGSRKAAERAVRPILALRDGVREIAMGNFDSKVEIQAGDEIGELADSVNAMGLELKAYVENLSKVTAEKERIATELDLATNIQEGMLPSIFPTFSDRSDFALYATMNPAKEVGGDFYDFRRGSVELCREALGAFLRELAISVVPQTMRGAPIPTGEDVLLCAGEKVYFVGDAAGLIHATSGAGIHFALISAGLLAESLLGGAAYEVAMRPYTEGIARIAANAKKTQ